MSKRANNINLFDYTDYRQFLRDWYTREKESRAGYSFRTFSKKSGFTSPNFFKMVMDGDRNLTEESLNKFLLGLKLNKQEQDFFRNLVFYNQARTHSEKDSYYQRLLQSRKFNQLKPLEKSQYEFYSTWYHSVIREMITSANFDGTPEWIAERISPTLSLTQIEKSLELLQELGMIQKNEREQWTQSSPVVSTGDESSSLVLLNYHQSLLELTKERVAHIEPHERDVSSLTLGIEEGKLPLLKKRIQEFRQEILKLVANDINPDQVVFLNIQLLPATKNLKTGDLA